MSASCLSITYASPGQVARARSVSVRTKAVRTSKLTQMRTPKTEHTARWNNARASPSAPDRSDLAAIDCAKRPWMLGYSEPDSEHPGDPTLIDVYLDTERD
ncbi:hypothetical protein GCM10027414_37010 [Humibacter ginsengiterrae]